MVKSIRYINVELIFTSLSSHCSGIKVIPLFSVQLPTTGKFAKFRITVNTGLLIVEHTCVLGLILGNTIITEVIVVSIHLHYTGKLFAVLVVSKAAVFNCPAVLNFLNESIAVFESLIGAAEACAGLAGKVGVNEGFKTVNLLIFGLKCEGIESVSSEECVVAESTGVDYAETIVCTPISAVLRCKLNACYHAEGVSCCGIDCLSLVNPVELKCYSVCSLIEFYRCKGEVLVENLEVADINVEIVVEVNNCRNLCEYAYTLCELEEEVPRSCIFKVCTGEHVNKVSELRRNGNLSHIDSKDIRGCHILVDINYSISNVIKGCGVCNIAEPSELTIATRSHVEIKGIFTLLKHVKSNGAAYRCIVCEACCNLNNLNAGKFVSNEYVAVKCTCLAVFSREYDIAHAESNGLVVVACSDGKNSVRAINCIHVCSGEVYVFGNNNVHSCHTDNLTVEHHINFNCTVSLTGEYAISGNRSETIVGNCPSVTFGKLGFITCGTDTGCIHLNRCTDGCIGIFAGNVCMIEFSGAGSCGNDHPGSRYGTLETVGGAVENAEFRSAGLSCNESRRSTTVKVYSLYATCITKNLSDFNIATTAGIGFLTAVKYHKYNLTGLGDTNCGSGSTAVSIVSIAYADFTVFNKSGSEACDSFLNLSLVNGVVLFGSADNGSTVLKNTKETTAVNCMILNAAHYEHTAGFTGRHIKACTVNSCNYLVVGNVIFAVGIAILVLSRISLIKYTLHCPTC